MTVPIDLSKYQVKTPIDLSKYTEHPEIVDDTPEGVLSSIGNTFAYMKNAILNKSFAEKLGQLTNVNSILPKSFLENPFTFESSTGNALVKNAKKFVTSTVPQVAKDVLFDFGNPMETETGKQIGSAIQNLGGTSSLNPIETLGGIGAGMVSMLEVPVSLLTQTHNEKGEAIPSSPEQQAETIQKAVGMALQIGVATKLIGALSPETLAGEASVVPSRIGTMTKSVAANVTGQMAGGLAGGIVGNIGQDDLVAKAIGEALSFAPLGVIFGSIHGRGVLKKAEGERGKFLSSDESAQEIAALKSMQTTTGSSVDEIVSNISNFSSSDNLVTAAIKSKLDVGKGMIVEGLSDEKFKQITEELKPSERVTEGVYVPSEKVQKKLNMMRPNLGGVKPIGLNLIDTFDKAVYFGGGKSKSANMILSDLIEKTGLSESEILSHRAQIKEAIKGKASTNDFTMNEAGVPFINVEKQNFSPQTGRAPYEFNTYKSGDNTLITPWKLNKPTEEFFNRTGYLPNEIVSVSGVDHAVKGFQNNKVFVENLTSGDKTYIDLSDITRQSSNLTSEFYKDKNGNQLGRAGILNRENYFNKMYDKFKETFLLDGEPKGSYADNILKFGQEVGIENKGDLEQLQKAFYNKLQEEVANGQGLTEEFKSYSGTKQNLLDWNKRFRSELGTSLHQSLNANGMYMVPEGAGVYTIKSVEDGKVMETVKSANEALKFVNKSGQTNAFDLDGGDTNGVPTASGNLGSLATPYTIDNPASAKWWDTKINAGKYATALVPIGKELAAQDAIKGTKFKNHFDALQRASGILKAKVQDPKAFKPLEESYNKVVKFANEKGIKDETRLQHVSDYIETMSIPEIVNRLLPRKLNSYEIASASQLSKLDVESMLNYMYDVRTGTNAKIGSADFQAKQAEIATKLIGKTPKYEADIVNAGNEMFKKTLQPPNVFSPFAVIRLAKGLKNPDLALDRKSYAARMKLSADEIKLGDMVDEILKQGGDRFGIDNSSRIAGYLPHAKIATAVGFNPWANVKTNTEFSATLSRLGVMQNDVLQRNPLLLARNYIYAGTRTAKIIPEAWAYPELAKPGNVNMLSFNDVVKKSEDYVQELSKDASVAPYSEVFNEHIMDVKGVPDLSEQLGRAAQKHLEELFGKSQASGGNWTKAGILLVHAAFLGGRLALTLRDVMNASTNMYGLYGAKFTKDALGSSVSKDYATALMEKGIIPKQNGLDLLMPGEQISAGLDRLTKVANTTMKYNGNQLVHTQISSGIYKATWEKVGELSGKMLKNEISKKKAYDELKIDQLDPATQKQFDDLISDGKTDQAAEILGRYRVRQIVNIYGNTNNPQAWNTAFGRVAGGFMSWGVNQAQTLADGVLRGSTRHRIESGVRYGIANATIATAGYYAGVNLSGWLINPFSLVSTSPLISLGMTGMKALAGLTSQNVNQREDAEKEIMTWVPHNEKTLAHAYLPYSYMVQDWVNGVNQLNNNFGPSGFGRMVGMPTNTSTRSPLQEDLGLYPTQAGKTLPNENVTPTEKKIFGR